MKFGNRKGKVGRPEIKDREIQVSIRVRESVPKEIGDMNRTGFFEKCRMNSMNV